MFDLHCHLLPGTDDGAKNIEMSLAMARIAAADGISVVASTPHIFPGIDNNTGPAIRTAVARLWDAIVYAGIPVRLVTGADVHIASDLRTQLIDGREPTLTQSEYFQISARPRRASERRRRGAVFLSA